jgi:hypothetical protein
LALLASAAVAQVRSADGLWTSLPAISPADQAAEPWVRPLFFRPLALDAAAMRAVLSQAPMEFTTEGNQRPLQLSLPTPDGGFARFNIVESPVMEPGLAAKFPDVRTYRGQGIDDPASNVRLDITPLGFHAQVIGSEAFWAIDPYSRNNTTLYSTYHVKNLKRIEGWQCHFNDAGPRNLVAGMVHGYSDRATGNMRREYRIAVAATASFCAFYGGTVAQAQAGIVTIVNRLNQVYENEVSVHFNLVANNTSILYTDAATQPYTDGDLDAMLDENQANIDAVIGNANYEIGHVVSGLNLGGLAQRPAICLSNGKAIGGTGLGNPSGDFFSVQYMGHEIGHQCGGSHSFNADDSAQGNICLPNRSGSTAYEPGSGSTIMAYSSLCGSNNQLQGTSDPMFNQGAYAQIASTILSSSCVTNVATGNTAPAIPTIAARTLPIGTPFTATAAATDVNGDSLTYSWEERGVSTTFSWPAQPAMGTGSADNGTSPLFRVFAPVAIPSRTFPKLSDILTGVQTIGERLPALTRTSRFRVTVRDNRSGGGGVNTADVFYSFNQTAGPFRVTSQATSTSVDPGPVLVTWDVANTNLAPISCANVRVLLSTDGGQTFPTVLVASTPNNGSATVTIPNVAAPQCRFRVEAVDNVFFDINHSSFAINCQPPTTVAATDSLCNRVDVSWSAVAGATQYRVSRATTNNSAAALTLSTLSSSLTTYADNFAVAGTQYYYWVRTIASSCTSGFGPGDPGLRASSPSITSQPSGLSITSGQPALLTVAAAGIPLSHQWRKNGNPVSNGGAFSGATSGTLSINPALTTDAGTYDCIVSTPCASVTSNAVALVVNPLCIADVDDGSGTGTPDGGIGIEDLLYYLAIYDAGSASADVDDGTGTGVHDGGVGIEDLLYFLARYDAGC